MNSNALERKITTASVLQFVFPSIITMVFMSMYTIVDGIFVSRLVGTDAFSAVNIVYPMFSVVLGLGTMFGSGATAVISRKLGEGKRQEACENFSFVIAFSLILGLVLGIIGAVFLQPIILFLGADARIYDYCVAYASPLLLFFPANIVQMQFQNLFVANGKPQLGLATTLLSGMTNIALDYLFIGPMQMGVAGAAWGTGLSCLLSSSLGILYFAVKRNGNFCFVKPKADWGMLAGAAANGSSEMVTALSGSVTTLLFNIIMMRFIGPDGVAAISVILYLDFVLLAISIGYSMGIVPLISYNYGKGDAAHLKSLFRISTAVCLSVGILMTVCTRIFAHPLTAVFAPEDSPVYQLASNGLLVFSFFYLFKGYNIFSSALFTAFGNGKISAFLSFMRTLVLLSGSILLLSWLLGIDGVWWSAPAAEFPAFLIGVYCIWKFKDVYHYAGSGEFLQEQQEHWEKTVKEPE